MSDKKPSGLYRQVTDATKAAAEHLAAATEERDRPTDPAPPPVCGRHPLDSRQSPCDLDNGHVGPCRHPPRPKPSESAQMAAVRSEREASRDMLANMRASLRPDDAHGHILAGVLAQQLDAGFMQELTLERLGRIEVALTSEIAARQNLERRVEKLERRVDALGRPWP